MKSRLHLLTSTAFIAGLALLLSNDLLFKPVFHNWVTGKLSDLAGLFIFPLFWTAFAPRRKVPIYILTAIGFIFWKSIYSQPVIGLWNSLPLLKIARTVDLTDLVALLALPLSYFYEQRLSSARPLAARRFATCIIILASVFAFTATQREGDHMVTEDKEYEFNTSSAELLNRLNHIGLKYVNHHRMDDEQAQRLGKIRGTPLTEEDRNEYSFSTPSKFCNDTVYANVTLHERAGKAVLRREYLIYNCDVSDQAHDREAVGVFERDVINRLRDSLATAPD